MKILLSLLIVASSISAQAQGSIHLTAGQSYTYSFSTVPYLGIGADANYGFATWYFANGSSYAPGTQALLEMFETSVTDAPVRSRLTSFFFDSSSGGNGVGGSGLWQDVQGVMRLTVASGAVDLSGMKVEVLGGPFDPFGRHVQLVSVPEPSSLWLFGLGMLALYSFSKWRGQGLTWVVRPIMRTSLLLVVFAVFCGCSTRQQPSVAPSPKPQAAQPDAIDQLVSRLSSPSHSMWHNGVYSPVKLSGAASTDEVLRQVFQKFISMHGSHVGRHQILETRQVRIPTAGPSDAYTAVLVETDLGRKIVLLQYESPGLGWWSRVYDA